LQLANFKLKLGRYQDAAPDFEQLVKENEHDTKAIAGYVMCLSQSDPFQASSYLDVLKQQIIVENVDEDILEVLPGRAAKASIEKTKSKRKRSKPVPKNFNPDALPDPERWLPKYLRSNVKKPKTKSTGFQGVVLEGGGIGGTGSARIAGMKAPSLPLMEKKTESEKIQKKPIPAVLLSKKKKRK
jgi:signal recognition particle subunit SRP72